LYGEIFDAVVALLFRHDPIGINFEKNVSEYEPEAETIIPRLEGCRSSEEVLHVVHEEFIRWFGAETAGAAKGYEQIAAEIWELWTQRSARPNAAS